VRVATPSLAAVKDVRTLVVTTTLRTAADRLADRLGAVHIVTLDRWRPVSEQLFVDGVNGAGTDSESTAVLVGPPAFVLKHATAATEKFGFVTPIALTSRRWQRAMNWRDDATLDLWSAGWSPRALDRVLVPSRSGTFEFAIGDVRSTPQIATPNSTAGG